MIDRDLAMAKLTSIDRCLKRINHITKNGTLPLNDLDIQDVFVLNLQRAIQVAIDLSSHIVSAKNLGVPKTLRESFEILAGAQLISADLKERLCRMVGFRNIAIHEYQVISEAVLQAISKEHLSDLKDFSKAVAKLL